MNWIAAYINAVKTNLPVKQRDDVGEELEDLLEEGFARDVGKVPAESSESEVIEWLAKREHPAVIAARYHDRRSLVGEESFPLFKLTMGYVLVGLVVAYGTVAVLQAVSTGNYNLSIFDFAKSALHAGLMAFACVTLIFHFFGSKLSSHLCLSKWSVKDLPDPDSSWEQVPWSTSVSSFVFNIIFLLLVNGIIETFWVGGEKAKLGVVDLQFTESVVDMLPWVNVLVVASIFLHGIMIVRSSWSTATLVFQVVLNALTFIVVGQLLENDVLAFPADLASSDSQRGEQLMGILNTSFRYGLYFVMGMSVFEVVRSFVRISRLGGRRLY